MIKKKYGRLYCQIKSYFFIRMLFDWRHKFEVWRQNKYELVFGSRFEFNWKI